ncbi:MAG: bifunctional hydroxymethylpyrimidine kinase/phosphomethylpyrimidine kinase [Gammaproteobacteria bacterium]
MRRSSWPRAGVAADLRTFAACGVHGCVAVTAVTVQNSVGVFGVHTVPPAVASSARIWNSLRVSATGCPATVTS